LRVGCLFFAGWRWRLSGLRGCASFLPDGAGAYPAYGVVPLFCRMVLALIRPAGLCLFFAGWRWRLSGLRGCASFLPDGAGAYPAYGDRRRL